MHAAADMMAAVRNALELEFGFRRVVYVLGRGWTWRCMFGACPT